MLLDLTPEDRAFRDEVRTFLRERLDPDVAHRVREHGRVSAAETVVWQKRLHAQGWFAPAWPVEWGGTGWPALRQYIYDEEYHAAAAPQVISFGRDLLAPVLMKFASEAQKRHYLPRILASDDWWCQGYSEPGAGSDLASLRTAAELRGDHYLINGQKTWTTLAQHADMMFCLVRTQSAGKKQEGISFLLIDMKTPGITVRPIVLLDGHPEVNEVWFENVEVPVANRIGDEGRGWTYAKHLLGQERAGIAGIGVSKREIGFLKELAGRALRRGRPLLEDPEFRAKVARVEIELMALELTALRVVSSERAGKAPGPEASMLKIRGTEIQQGITELFMEAVGPFAQPFTPEAFDASWHGEPVGADYAAPLAARYFNFRKTSIYGGSNEIQKNIIAQMILGL